AKLVLAFQKLVDLGHTVVIVEHNLDLVLAADHVIELGPGGGADGGRLVAQGTPEQIERDPRSPTGEALRAQRAARESAGKRRNGSSAARPAPAPIAAAASIAVRGARTHNL